MGEKLQYIKEPALKDVDTSISGTNLVPCLYLIIILQKFKKVRHDNLRSKILLCSNLFSMVVEPYTEIRALFLVNVCQSRSRQNRRSFTLPNVKHFAPDCGKFAVKRNWKSKTSEDV